MPDNKNCKDFKYYFDPVQAKVRGAIQFCKHMGIDYIKRDIFQTFNIFTYQNH